MTKAVIQEILTTKGYKRKPEMTKKPEIFQFFSIFDLKRENFSNFFYTIFLYFLLRVLCRKDYSNRFSSLEDTKNDQKNTLRLSSTLTIFGFKVIQKQQ